MDIESRKQLFNDITSKVKHYKIAVDGVPKIESVNDIPVDRISISKRGALSVEWYEHEYDTNTQSAYVGEIRHKFVCYMTGVFMSDEDALATAKNEIAKDLDYQITEAKQELSQLEEYKRRLMEA